LVFHQVLFGCNPDLPTPMKYYSKAMRQAFRGIEHKAEVELLALLLPHLQKVFALPATTLP
jgi:5'-deoxynucleotidase